MYTVNMHLLLHVGEIIRRLGPLSGVSAASMERAIGVNAANVLLRLQACRYFGIVYNDSGDEKESIADADASYDDANTFDMNSEGGQNYNISNNDDMLNDKNGDSADGGKVVKPSRHDTYHVRSVINNEINDTATPELPEFWGYFDSSIDKFPKKTYS
ncbi:hypothetical protein BDA99DRAFT_560395 [Phascolomyces articulosus]|uniref:Uncharacterized protein n=1 Tax=Phascolomyces articulosus TaxID=60185 RepID=A0AAD5JZ66_9FUNG|nr:hypothetical protein BDA99DRAFT_560395 [Phascolomyces articulosus]